MRRLALAFAGALLACAAAQPAIDTTFDAGDLARLERLVAAAQAHDAEIGALVAARRADAVTAERLRNAFSLTIGGGIAGDIYGQVDASYRIGIGLDLLELLPNPLLDAQISARLDDELRRVRLATVEAFVRYRIAEERAAAAAIALDSARAHLGIAQARHEVGDLLLADVLAARSEVGTAAVALLTANGEVVIALEGLAATAGLGVESARRLLRGP